jgi:hypothetical protein
VEVHSECAPQARRSQLSEDRLNRRSSGFAVCFPPLGGRVRSPGTLSARLHDLRCASMQWRCLNPTSFLHRNARGPPTALRSASRQLKVQTGACAAGLAATSSAGDPLPFQPPLEARSTATSSR